MKKNELRKIPVKNYIILGIVMVVTCLVLYYFYLWVDVYKESKINIPIMDKYMTVINYNELDNYIVENPDSIVYVSVLEDETIRKFEKELKLKYKNRLINKEILYMNITEEYKDNDIMKDIMSKYNINNLNIPYVFVFSDGKIKSVYSISDNDYNVDRFTVYINNIELESDGI